MPGKHRPSKQRFKDGRRAKRGILAMQPRGNTGNIYIPTTGNVTPGNGTLSSKEKAVLYGVPSPGRSDISSASARLKRRDKR